MLAGTPTQVTVRFRVPVAILGRRYWLTAVAGQSGGRLRVHRILVDERARIWLPVENLTGWRTL